MLADLVGEVISAVIGDAIGGWLSPDVKPGPPPPEGEWNASIGSLAAFLAGIAAMFCGLATFGVLQSTTEVLLWFFLGGSVVLAMLSGVLANRALEVTSRRRALARIALWLSRATIVTGLVGAVLAVAGVTVALR